MKYAKTALAFVLSFSILGGLAFAQMMGPPPSIKARAFAAARAGQPVQIVVRVRSLKRSALRAEILDKKTDSDYQATGNNVELFFPQNTRIIMGTISDISPGAVLSVTAVATKPKKADVKKVVVITQYVKVH
jgi:uncharacterized protein YycO